MHYRLRRAFLACLILTLRITVYSSFIVRGCLTQWHTESTQQVLMDRWELVNTYKVILIVHGRFCWRGTAVTNV